LETTLFWAIINLTSAMEKVITTTTAVKKPVRKKTDKKPSRAESPSDRIRRIIVKALDDNKAEDISLIDMTGKSSFADLMIVASGRSARHVAALAGHVSDALRLGGYGSPQTEGMNVGDWVLMDAGDVIVHLFRPEVRQLYNIEKMWSLPVGIDAKPL
jgi:ribosome-associated protein